MKLFFIFAWIFSLLVLAAFSDIVANTFNGYKADGALNSPNAAAASISMLFIVVAIIFGLFIRYKKPSQKLQFAIGVVLLIGMLALGIACPIYLGKSGWLAVVYVYIFFAAILPMWILMQPVRQKRESMQRDLNGITIISIITDSKKTDPGESLRPGVFQ